MAALAAEARFVDPEIEKAPVVQVKQASVPGKADSLLPRGKTWRLVWHDEFDGAEIDKSKWMCRGEVLAPRSRTTSRAWS